MDPDREYALRLVNHAYLYNQEFIGSKHVKAAFLAPTRIRESSNVVVIEKILACLNRIQVRATYGAVGEVMGIPAIGGRPTAGQIPPRGLLDRERFFRKTLGIRSVGLSQSSIR